MQRSGVEGSRASVCTGSVFGKGGMCRLTFRIHLLLMGPAVMLARAATWSGLKPRLRPGRGGGTACEWAVYAAEGGMWVQWRTGS